MKHNNFLPALTFILFSLIYSNNAHAQKECNIWYFGNGAGLDFNSGAPVSINGGMIYTSEGCATVCDTSGAILFYSDGMSVWNKNHQVMPNGSGLTGDISSTQSATIVKDPGAPGIYYIFTTYTTLNYSIVDMSLNGGLGDITASKNIFLMNGSEKICAVKHANGNDVWIIMHEALTDGFNAFLLTASGVNMVPVHSNSGLPDNGLYGQMKVSPTGTKIAAGLYNNGATISLCDFDPATGIVSNGFGLTAPNIVQTYGLEFSPDGTKLYTSGESGWYSVTQFDMNAGTQAAIIASATIVGTSVSNMPVGMQLGPDRKIYIALYGSYSLAVINYPDSLGLTCNFQDNAVSLGANQCQLGLPGIVASFFSENLQPNAIFSSPNHICPGTCTDFTNLSTNATSFLWSFPGGNPTVSVDVNPSTICYNAPGHYDVQLIATNANGSDTLLLHNYITVFPTPPAQGILQNGDTLFANTGASLYQWYYNGTLINGATNYFYVATQSGNFSVIATDENGCEVEAVINNVIAGLPATLSKGEGVAWLYPNPADDKIEIRNLNPNTETFFFIYNAIGEVVQLPTTIPIAIGSEPPTCSLDVSNLSTGIYWLCISENNVVSRIQFMKK
jgi:PKD repeat protein